MTIARPASPGPCRSRPVRSDTARSSALRSSPPRERKRDFLGLCLADALRPDALCPLTLAARWARMSSATAGFLQRSAQLSASAANLSSGMVVSAPAAKSSGRQVDEPALSAQVQRRMIAVVKEALGVDIHPTLDQPAHRRTVLAIDGEVQSDGVPAARSEPERVSGEHSLDQLVAP